MTMVALLLATVVGVDCGRPECPASDLNRRPHMLYPCLLDEATLHVYKDRAQGNRYRYAEVLWMHYLSDRSDRENALPWLDLAAKQGYAHSQFTLGKVLLEQARESAEQSTALQWMTWAASSPSQTFSAELAEVYLALGDQGRALDWFEFSAKIGNERSLERLLSLYVSFDMRREYCTWSRAAVTDVSVELPTGVPECLSEEYDLTAADELAEQIAKYSSAYERHGRDRCEAVSRLRSLESVEWAVPSK